MSCFAQKIGELVSNFVEQLHTSWVHVITSPGTASITDWVYSLSFIGVWLGGAYASATKKPDKK